MKKLHPRFSVRVWRPKLGKMTYPIVGYVPATESENIMMQCTGRADCTGEPIFEGDYIMDMDYNPYLVEWDEGWLLTYWLMDGNGENKQKHVFNMSDYDLATFAITGNRYEGTRVDFDKELVTE